MLKPNGFADFYARSARADGGADVAATATTTGSDGRTKWSPEAWSAFIASLGTLFGSTLSGAANIIDSTNNSNNAALQTAGAQNVVLPGARNNNALLWVFGGGVLLLILLVLVLRK